MPGLPPGAGEPAPLHNVDVCLLCVDLCLLWLRAVDPCGLHEIQADRLGPAGKETRRYTTVAMTKNPLALRFVSCIPTSLLNGRTAHYAVGEDGGISRLCLLLWLVQPGYVGKQRGLQRRISRR